MKRSKTTVAKPADVTRKWYVVDASANTLGRVATVIARTLSGKDKVDYTPHVDSGDYVIVVNADKLQITGNKDIQKTYYNYTGYPGNLRSKTLGTLRTEDPVKVVESAVYGMLPKNKLRTARMERLKVYTGSEHPHAANKPTDMELQ